MDVMFAGKAFILTSLALPTFLVYSKGVLSVYFANSTDPETIGTLPLEKILGSGLPIPFVIVVAETTV